MLRSGSDSCKQVCLSLSCARASPLAETVPPIAAAITMDARRHQCSLPHISALPPRPQPGRKGREDSGTGGAGQVTDPAKIGGETRSVKDGDSTSLNKGYST